MGPKPGRPRKGELPDLGIYPPGDDCFEPSFVGPTERMPYRFPLTIGHLAGLETIYRAGTTDVMAFALWQSIYSDVDDKWHSVFRIDTWHGTVHRHDFRRSGNNLRTDLVIIPSDHAGTVMEVWRKKARGIIMAEWEDNVRRWHDDRQ